MSETENTQVAKASVSPSERFMNAVLKEVAKSTGDANISEYQKRLSKNYFINLDGVLKKAEAKRMAKKEEFREPVPYSWENINMPALAIDVVAYSSIGLDPTQKNHLSLIPYKDNVVNNNYKIEFREEYRGMELKAKKYGFEIPDDIIIEVVYVNDHFKSLKKSNTRKVESYEFEVKDDFDRGEIKGGFYYYDFKSNPEKNRVRVFNMDQILKRVPKNAAVEFWGGEKDIWKNGQKTNQKEQVEGWKDEMVYKTIARAAYNNITIDASKIDDHVLRMIENDQNSYLLEVNDTPEQNNKGNLKTLNIDDAQEAVEVKEEPKTLAQAAEKPQVKAPEKPEKVKPEEKEPLVNNEGVGTLNFD